MQFVTPEFVGENDRPGSVTTVVGRTEQPAEYRMQSHDFEVVSVDDSGRNLARRPQPDDGEVDFGERAELLDGLQMAVGEVLNLGNREIGIGNADPRCGLAHIEQPALILVGQGAKQHRADDAEDRCVGADSERQSKTDGQPERGNTGQGAYGNLEIMEKRHLGLRMERRLMRPSSVSAQGKVDKYVDIN